MPESKPSKKAEESQTSSASGKPLTPEPVAPKKSSTPTTPPKPGKTAKGSQPAKPVKVKVKKPQTVGNPRWLVPTMLALFIVGILWVVTFYLTSGGARLPIPPLGQWNIAVGFALILVGFGLSTRWK